VQKLLPQWAFGVLSVVGVVLVGSMFVNWYDTGWSSSWGITLAWENKHWLFLVPICGALLVATSASRSEYTRLAAIAAGIVIAGDVMFQFAKGFIGSGLESWLIFGGAGVILGGISSARRSWRVAGGLAVLAGFFAPWTNDSMWYALTRHADMIVDAGVTFRILWLIPIAALAAIGSGSSTSVKGGRTALFAGIAIYGSFLWVIGSAANLVLAWGAWSALGASTVALVIGVFAGVSRPLPAKA